MNRVCFSQYHDILPEDLHQIGNGGYFYRDGYRTSQMCSREEHLKCPLAFGIIRWGFVVRSMS